MSLGRSRPESLLVVGLDERDHEGWTTRSQPVSNQGCQIGLDFPAQSGNPGCNGLPDSAGKSGNPVLPNTSGRRETRDEPRGRDGGWSCGESAAERRPRHGRRVGALGEAVCFAYFTHYIPYFQRHNDLNNPPKTQGTCNPIHATPFTDLDDVSDVKNTRSLNCFNASNPDEQG